jgi:hypothetical protein
MDFKLKHLTLKSQVIQILKQDKKARTDYFWLCLLVWIKQDAIKFNFEKNLSTGFQGSPKPNVLYEPSFR